MLNSIKVAVLNITKINLISAKKNNYKNWWKQENNNNNNKSQIYSMSEKMMVSYNTNFQTNYNIKLLYSKLWNEHIPMLTFFSLNWFKHYKVVIYQST